MKQLDRSLERFLAEVEGVIVCSASHANVQRPEGVDGDWRAPEEERLALDQRHRSPADWLAAECSATIRPSITSPSSPIATLADCDMATDMSQ